MKTQNSLDFLYSIICISDENVDKMGLEQSAAVGCSIPRHPIWFQLSTRGRLFLDCESDRMSFMESSLLPDIGGSQKTQDQAVTFRDF